jgi:hypothetical protein
MPGYFAVIDMAQPPSIPPQALQAAERRGAATAGGWRADALEDPEPRLAVFHRLGKRLELRCIA